jgi:TolB protein
MYKRLLSCLTLVGLILASTSAHAVLTIEITQGAEVGIPIAVVPFSWQGKDKPEHAVSDIVTMDLARSGRFAIVPKENYLSSPHTDKEIVFKDWRISKAEALVIGTVRQMPSYLSIVRRIPPATARWPDFS